MEKMGLSLKNVFDPFNIYDATKAAYTTPAPQATGADVKKLQKSILPDPYLEYVSKTLNALKALYISNGLSETQANWNMVQDYSESAAFTNRGAKMYNNPGNIMWPDKGLPYGRRGGYNAVNKSYYASFPNLADYVKEKIKVISQAPGRPIEATDLKDYVHRLKLNNYFGKKESEQNYYNSLVSTKNRLNLISDLKEDEKQIIVMPLHSQGGGLKWWVWALIAVGGIIVIKKVSE